MRNADIIIAGLKEWGVQGILGKVHNQRILEYFKKSGNEWVIDDETAWCAAFVNFILSECKVKGTQKLNARSFLDYGVKTKFPEVGDIVVFWRISKESVYGHVGFFIKENLSTISVLGGNHGNTVSIIDMPKKQFIEYRKVWIT